MTVLLRIKQRARPIFIEIVVSQHAEVGQIIAVGTLMQDLTEEDDELQLMAEIERLRQRCVLVQLIPFEVLEKLVANAIPAIQIVVLLIACARFIFKRAINHNRLPNRRELRCIYITNCANLRHSWLLFRSFITNGTLVNVVILELFRRVFVANAFMSCGWG